jgi:hypothetical protein
MHSLAGAVLDVANVNKFVHSVLGEEVAAH